MEAHIAESGSRETLTDDPAALFFKHLSSPEDHHQMIWSKVGREVCMVISKVLSLASSNCSDDPDYELLKKAMVESYTDPKGAIVVYEYLTGLAMSKTLGLSDCSYKARQLRYLLWVGSGRKDETSPFPSPFPSPSQPHASPKPAQSQVHATSKCCACKKDNATLKCGGCLISAETDFAFSTVYCSKDCQKKNWATHKTACREVQAFRRAVAMFMVIFQHFLAITYQNEYELKTITQEHGMVVASMRSKAGANRSSWCSFPFEIAQSRDLAAAVLMHTQCASPLGDARALFEMLIRPTCQPAEAVVFVPKDMDEPVRIIHPDFNEFSSLAMHEVIRATLPCGLKSAFDPTGLQLGWKHAIVPWEAYSRHRIHIMDSSKLVKPQPPGYTVIACALAHGTSSRPSQSLRGSLMETVAHGVNKQLDLVGLESNVKKLLQLNAPNFNTARTAVVAAANRGLSYLAKEIEKGARPTCAMPQQLNISLESDLQVRFACGMIDLLWYTKEEALMTHQDFKSAQESTRQRWYTVLNLRRLPGLEGGW